MTNQETIVCGYTSRREGHQGPGNPKITDIRGRPVGDGVTRAEHNGYMIALRDGIVVLPDMGISETETEEEDDILAPLPSKD